MNTMRGQISLFAVAMAIAPVFVAPATLAALEVPPLTGRIVDNAGIISHEAENVIDDYFRRIEEATGAQIAILTIPSLEGEILEQYSIRVVDQWRLGQASADNGALLLIAMQERSIRIEVGYGLEGRLTDATSGAIIREYLQPYFRAGDYDAGVLVASQAIGSIVADDVTGLGTVGAENRSTGTAPRSRTRGAPLNLGFFFIIFILGSLARSGRGRRRGSGFLGGLFLGSTLGSASRRHYRGGFGGFGGGSFGGGSFGGGGFSGGGGGFGGGGASGGW